MSTTKFLQVLRVEDFRIEAGATARPGAHGQQGCRASVRIWLHGAPATQFSKVNSALLEAVAGEQGELAIPRYDFHHKRIVIAYTPATIQPVVSLLLDGVQLHCQFREWHGGAVHADVYLAEHKIDSIAARPEPHWEGLPSSGSRIE